MRGKYELWVIIFLQVVAMEVQQAQPNLLDIILIMVALAAGKKMLFYMKEEQEHGNKYNQHTDHLHYADNDLCDQQRRQG